MTYERLLLEFKDRYEEFCENEGIFVASGALLRPRFIFALADCIAGTADSAGALNEVLNFALIVELVHNASLVHDDIIDDEMLRRGQQSIYSKMGAKKAVVFGDLIFMKGFKLLSEIKNENISDIVISTAISLCKGELLEMTPQNGRYFEMISLKTASLFKCAAHGAATILQCDEHLLKQILILAGALGEAYQIKDDLRDGDIDFEQWGTDEDIVRKHFNALENRARGLLKKLNASDELVNYTEILLS